MTPYDKHAKERMRRVSSCQHTFINIVLGVVGAMDNKALTGCILIFMLLLSAFISLSILFMTQTEQAMSNDEELARHHAYHPQPELDSIGRGIDAPSRNKDPSDESSEVTSTSMTPLPSTTSSKVADPVVQANQQLRTRMLAVIPSPHAGGKFVGVETPRDGRLLYLPKSDGQIELYDVASPTSPRFLRSIDMPSGLRIHRAKLLHNDSGQFVVIDAGMRHMVRIDANGKMVGKVIEFPDFQAIDVAVSPADVRSRLLSAGNRRLTSMNHIVQMMIYVLVRSRNEIHCYSEELAFAIRLIKFKTDNDGDHCRFIEASERDLFVSCLSGIVQISRESGRVVRKLAQPGSAYSLAMSYISDGKLLAAEGRHGEIQVFNTHKGGASESVISPSSPNVTHVWTGIKMIGGNVLAALNHMSGRIHLFPLY